MHTKSLLWRRQTGANQQALRNRLLSPTRRQQYLADTNLKFRDQHIRNTSNYGDEVEHVPGISEVILNEY